MLIRYNLLISIPTIRYDVTFGGWVVMGPNMSTPKTFPSLQEAKDWVSLYGEVADLLMGKYN